VDALICTNDPTLSRDSCELSSLREERFFNLPLCTNCKSADSSSEICYATIWAERRSERLDVNARNALVASVPEKDEIHDDRLVLLASGMPPMPNILLVEDSPTQAMQMKVLLESANHCVVCCDDGTSALEHLASGKNEIVVTDLELPVMNGLDLVKQMSVDFPHIPTILVTSHGSERLAAEALRTGAAAYVPKVMLGELLLSTVEDVLGVLRTDRSYSQLIDCTIENRLVFELPNDPRLTTNAINLVMQICSGMQLLTGSDSYRVGTALQHAMSNALYRGNLELRFDQYRHTLPEEVELENPSPAVADRLSHSPYKDRKIHFDARLMRDVIRFVVRDEGRGFDTPKSSPKQDPQLLSASRGRGLVLIYNAMDKVSFNGPGNEITMIKHCVEKDNY
jgi:CheY-like chemotaxis protein